MKVHLDILLPVSLLIVQLSIACRASNKGSEVLSHLGHYVTLPNRQYGDMKMGCRYKGQHRFLKQSR